MKEITGIKGLRLYTPWVLYYVLKFRTKQQGTQKLTSIFEGIITSKTRINILMRLFLNPDQEAYLRELSKEFSTPPSVIKEELKNLSKVGLLSQKKNGRQIFYRANTTHPLFPELHSMVKKALGMDKILDSIVSRLGMVKIAFLMDDYAKGRDTGIIDLVLVGDIDQKNLQDLVRKTERYIKRKIRPLVLTENEYEHMKTIFDERPILTLWTSLPNSQ